jgi:hypothetical protein
MRTLFFVASFLIVTAANAQNPPNVLSGKNVVLGQYLAPECTIPDAPVIQGDASVCGSDATRGIQILPITLTGNRGWTVPTNLGTGQFITYRFTQDSVGGRTLTADGTISAPDAAFAPGTNQIALAASPGQQTGITCYGIGGTAPQFVAPSMICGAPVIDIRQALPPAAFVAASPGSICFSAPKSCASGSLNVSGGIVAVLIGYCIASDCVGSGSQPVASVVPSGLGACKMAARAPGNVVIAEEIWWCPVSAAGAASVTAQWNASVYYPVVTLVNATGVTADDGVGQTAGGNNTTPTVTSGATTRGNEFIITGMAANGTATPTSGLTGIPLATAQFGGRIATKNPQSVPAGPSVTPVSVSGWIAAAYSVTNAAGPNTVGFSLSPPGPWGIAVAAFR